MSEDYLIGIDIGTQGTKTSLITSKGAIIADSFEESRLISPRAGIVEQDPEEIYSSVLNTIKEVMDKSGISPNKVSAIGLDGQMAGIMAIDKEWNAVTYYDSWLDTRCEKYINIMKQQAEEEVVRITGCPVTYAHGPKILWWKHKKPEVYKKIAKFIVPTTYVAGRLSGLNAEDAYIDYTHLHFSGYGDISKLEWSNELLEEFGIEKSKMPKILEPWKVVGKITEHAAEHCGLVSGIPVVAGCGDQAATSLGAGVTRKGIAFDVAGTASVFSCCVDKFNPDIKHKTLLFPRSVIPNLWIPLAYINGGGLCIRWFRDQLTGKEKKADYNELQQEAESIEPGSEGLVFIPHFGGRVCPNNPNVRGSWVGLNWAHQRGHMYRAIMESIAYEYRHYLKILKELIGEVAFTNVIAIGGGAKSSLFNSIKADVLGIPYSTLSRSDTATLGSAVVAGYGIKIYSDIASTVEKMIQTENNLQPNFENYKKYKKYVNIYEGLFGALEDTFRELNAER